jgi:hypothetical protein
MEDQPCLTAEAEERQVRRAACGHIGVQVDLGQRPLVGQAGGSTIAYVQTTDRRSTKVNMLNLTAARTVSRTAHCPSHGAVEATKQVPQPSFPFVLYGFRRLFTVARPYRCPMCGAKVSISSAPARGDGTSSNAETLT